MSRQTRSKLRNDLFPGMTTQSRWNLCDIWLFAVKRRKEGCHNAGLKMENLCCKNCVFSLFRKFWLTLVINSRCSIIGVRGGSCWGRGFKGKQKRPACFAPIGQVSEFGHGRKTAFPFRCCWHHSNLSSMVLVTHLTGNSRSIIATKWVKKEKKLWYHPKCLIFFLLTLHH